MIMMSRVTPRYTFLSLYRSARQDRGTSTRSTTHPSCTPGVQVECKLTKKHPKHDHADLCDKDHESQPQPKDLQTDILLVRNFKHNSNPSKHTNVCKRQIDTGENTQWSCRSCTYFDNSSLDRHITYISRVHVHVHTYVNNGTLNSHIMYISCVPVRTYILTYVHTCVRT